ncbi:MAG: ribonuclease H-like domain-containing protein [Lachnospiraceae bacterium]|nr:ribonuclease H-like domain-containing protein [Lachnospiraceae bacterium]
MITITKDFPRENLYPIESATKGLAPVLFDIETTGLSAKNATIYLIGAILIKRDRVNFVQWFAEGPSEERSVLDSFLSWLPDKSCLITFNGRGFDIPFLCKKCKGFDIPCYLPQMPDIDLYRALGPLKNYFDMPGRRLVAYEQLIGLNREDTFNGGELVDVYREYVGKNKFDKETAEELKAMLLLHNEEDIRDMLPVMSLLTYIDLFGGNYKSCEVSASSGAAASAEADQAGNAENSFVELTITMHSDFVADSRHTLATLPGIPAIETIASGNTARIRIPIVNGTFKHYFPDYKNYYYLPGEDTAIHKSIASAVESGHRLQATKTTAFTKASGLFVPQPREVINPSFKKDATDKISFAPLSRFASDSADLKSYVKSLF